MRAVAIEGYGDPGVARVLELDDPTPGPGEAAVRVRAGALNHLDLWTSSGALDLPISFPFVLGADGAGEVADVGPGVDVVSPGDRVLINPGISCGMCDLCLAGEQSMCRDFRMLGEHVNGTFAERVVVPATNVFRAPEHLTFEGAAAIGVTSITAYRMLFTLGRLRPGGTVLITGIGGGLALSLLQLALPVAARIIVTSSSPQKLERALALGAHDAIDYTSEDVGVAVRRLTSKRGVDLVADSAGGDTLDASMRSLAPGGRLVVAGATAGRRGEIDVRRLFWSGLQIVGSTMGSHSDVRGALGLIEASRIEPIVDSTYPMERASEALERLRSGEQFGKVVLQIA